MHISLTGKNLSVSQPHYSCKKQGPEMVTYVSMLPFCDHAGLDMVSNRHPLIIGAEIRHAARRVTGCPLRKESIRRPENTSFSLANAIGGLVMIQPGTHKAAARYVAPC